MFDVNYILIFRMTETELSSFDVILLYLQIFTSYMFYLNPPKTE